jgi:predicted ATPase/DNA-binding SARP family transcriptional activator
MDFRVLGPLEVTSRRGDVLIRSAQLRRLLAILLVHAGAVVSSDRLIDELWDGQPPAGAAQSMWTCVARLRRVLAAGSDDPVLMTRPPGYVLQVEPDQIDAARFERLLIEASRLSTDQAQSAVDMLTQGLALWRGPAFAEFVDTTFASAEAARLEELRLTAYERRCEAELELGRHAELIAGLQSFITANPLREAPRGQLMLALYRSGRQAEALEAYQTYQSLLQTELGLDPSALLRTRHARMLRQAVDLDWTPHRPPGAEVADQPDGSLDRPATRLTGQRRPGRGIPVELTSFVGRSTELVAVSADLAASRLVTLTGVGGVGKTRIALRSAETVSTAFPDGVWWCELAPLTDAAAVEPALSTVLGVQRRVGVGGVESVLAFLAQMRLLLVLDNCEHVLSGVRPIADAILSRCPGVAVLATSRTPLGVVGERLRPIAPLPLPLPGPGRSSALDSPAVKLFLDRARAVRPELDVTGTNLDRAVDVCIRLDGLPLAIELAAARVRSLNPADLAARLTDPFDLLSGIGTSVVGRHGTMQAVLDWSYNLLGTGQRRLFDRLSVFAGGFTLAAAEEVGTGFGVVRTEVVDLLTDLVDASMVTAGPTTGATRYSLLEMLRQYGLHHLNDRGSAETFRLAHARYFAAQVARADRGLRGPDEEHWVGVVDRDLDNLRSAHRWAVEHNNADLALVVSSGLRYYALYRFRDEVVSWGAAAIALPDAVGHSQFAVACGAVAEGLTARGELRCADALAEQILARASDPDDPDRMPGLRVAGMVALYEGRTDDGFRYHQEMLRLARLHHAPYETGMALLGLAQSRTYGGDAPAGLTFAEEQFRVAQQLKNPSMLALALYDQAEALSLTEPEAARDRYERAVGLAQAAGSSFIEGIALVGLASLLGRSGRPSTALPQFLAITDRWYDMGIWHHQWTTLRNLVQLLLRIGCNEDAAVLIHAIEASTTAAAAFGTDAERMADATDTLHTALGECRWSSALARGAAFSDNDAVIFARDAINRAINAASHDQPNHRLPDRSKSSSGT